MSHKQTGCFFCSSTWLTFLLMLIIVQGKDAHVSTHEENREVGVELIKADDGLIDNIKLPTGCNSRKLTKRSSSFGMLGFRDLENQETGCEIFPITPEMPLTTKPQATTPKPRKQTQQSGATVPRGPCGGDDDDKSSAERCQSDESSEEKGRRRIRFPVVRGRHETSEED